MKKSKHVDEKIAELADWRGEKYTELRKIIFESDPELAEEWKWNTATYVKKGNICSIGVFKNHIKLNFFKGAEIVDEDRLFNAGLESKSSRGIDFRKSDKIDTKKLTELIKNAIKIDLIE